MLLAEHELRVLVYLELVALIGGSLPRNSPQTTTGCRLPPLPRDRSARRRSEVIYLRSAASKPHEEALAHAAAFSALRRNIARQVGQARRIHTATDGHARRSSAVSSTAFASPQTSHFTVCAPRRPKR
jgi:hypothetical protein